MLWDLVRVSLCQVAPLHAEFPFCCRVELRKSFPVDFGQLGYEVSVCVLA